MMLTAAPSVTAEILLLEQNGDEVAIFEQATGSNHLNVVTDCPTILRFLRKQGDLAQAPRPDLILLDLDLSDKIGCEMLSQIKQDSALRRIPVVVLAASDSYDNIFQAYDLQANAYVRKPDDREQLVMVLRVTLHFWLSLARLPRE